MSTQRQDDTGLDRLLRSALVSARNAGGEDCPDADRVAAYADGGLSDRERTDLEPHLSSCARCQAILAVLAQESAPEPPADEKELSGWRAWTVLPSLRWLVPASAAAIGVVLYVAVQQGPYSDVDLTSPPAAAAPEMAMAERAVVPSLPEEGARSAAREPSRPAESPAGSSRASARPETPVAAKPPELSARTSVDVVAAAPPAARTDALPAALAVLDRPRPDSAPRVDAPRQTDLDTANAADATAGRKAASEHGRGQVMSAQAPRLKGIRVIMYPPNTTARAGVDTLWPGSDLVILARVVRSGPAQLAPADGTQAQPEPVVARVPMVSTEFDTIEVFKRKDTVRPERRVTVWHRGGEVEDATTVHRVPEGQWVTPPEGSEYVLFLVLRDRNADSLAFEPLGFADGFYRFDGNRVVIGLNQTPDPELSRGALLARLRQLAGTAVR